MHSSTNPRCKELLKNVIVAQMVIKVLLLRATCPTTLILDFIIMKYTS
jgi:hypothetical protein